MNNLVETLEVQFIRYFEKLVEELKDKYPNYKFHVISYLVGANTPHQGHHICLECVLPDMLSDQPDSLAIMVQLSHLMAKPRLMVDVSWVTGQIEIEMDDWIASSEWPEITDQTLEKAIALPKISRVFEEAIHRGYPLQK